MAPKLLVQVIVKDGHLSPWEIAKAIAYRNVLKDMSVHMAYRRGATRLGAARQGAA